MKIARIGAQGGDEVANAIIDMGGTCTGEHGIGAGKIASLEKEAGPGSIQVMVSIKNALDPKGILNPGKIFAPHI